MLKPSFKDYEIRVAQAYSHSGCWYSQSMLKPEEVWNDCCEEWERIINQDHGVKSYSDFLQVEGGLFPDDPGMLSHCETMVGDRQIRADDVDYAAKMAWNFQEKQWRHKVANKQTSINLLSDAVEKLKAENEALKIDLEDKKDRIEFYVETIRSILKMTDLEQVFLWCRDTLSGRSMPHSKTMFEMSERLKDADEVIAAFAKMYSHFNTEPQICCNGRDCACLGKPTNPEYYADKAIREYQEKYLTPSPSQQGQ